MTALSEKEIKKMQKLFLVRGEAHITVRGAGKGYMNLELEEIIMVLKRMTLRTIYAGDCWFWTGNTRNGYGSISIHDSPVYLHALSFAIAHGTLPNGHEIRHSCDVSSCWCPDHLLSGTRQDNVNDMWERGRAVAPPRTLGVNQHLARLTEAEVSEIRARYGKNGENQRSLAKDFDCSNSTIWRIVNEKVRT